MANYRRLLGAKNAKKRRKQGKWARKALHATVEYDRRTGGARVIQLTKPTTAPVKPKLQARLYELGYEDYKKYLSSNHWRNFKAAYRKAGMPGSCLVCFQPHAQLHHMTYERLGAEKLTDVIPLCQKHHSELHEYARVKGLPVEATRIILKDICGWSTSETDFRFRLYPEAQ